MQAPPSSGSDLLDIPPPERLACSQLPPNAADARIAFEYSFQVGNGPLEDTRSIRIGYDKQGGLILLSEQNIRRSSQSLIAQTIVVIIPPDGVAKGTRLRQELSVSEPARKLDDSSKDLTAADVDKAQRLASWLWDRRCDATPGG